MSLFLIHHSYLSSSYFSSLREKQALLSFCSIFAFPKYLLPQCFCRPARFVSDFMLLGRESFDAVTFFQQLFFFEQIKFHWRLILPVAGDFCTQTRSVLVLVATPPGCSGIPPWSTPGVESDLSWNLIKTGVLLENLRDFDRPVFLLVIFHNGNNCAANRKSRTV